MRSLALGGAWLALLVSVAPARADDHPDDDSGHRAQLDALDRDLDDVFVDGGLTAERAATLAEHAAPIEQRRLAELDAAEAELARARSGAVPTLAGKVGYQRLSPLESVILPLGPQQFVIPFFVDNYDLGAQLSVPISDYFARTPSLISSASFGVEAARLGMQATTSSVAEQARELYYEWVRAKLRVVVARRQLDQVRSTLKQIRSLVDVQRASTADVLRVESQQAQAVQLLDQLRSRVVLLERQLRLLIGADAGEELAVGEDIREDVAEPAIDDLDVLTARALDRRLEIKSLSAAIRAKRAQSRAESATIAPRLSMFASVDYADPNPRVFPEQDRFRLTWAAGAQVTWVLNEALVAGASRRRLASDADALDADRAQARQQVELDVVAAYEAVMLGKRSVETSRQGEQAAEESYRVRSDLFSVGRASVVEMIDVETELTRARIAALDARIDLRVAIARLAHAVGDKP